MSYYGRIGGYLAIDPPLKWSEIRDSEFFADNMSANFEPSIALVASREDVETDVSVNAVITCAVVTAVTESHFDCRGLDGDVRKLAQQLLSDGHLLKGCLIVAPQDYGDGGIWRVIADESGVRKEYAKLQWPDGSEVELP